MHRTTKPGYVNKNNQKVIGPTNRTSNHQNQKIYDMMCLDCGANYGANGSDIWLRLCPACMGGQPSSEAK